MEKTASSKWASAAKEGLVLAAVTVVCTLLSTIIKTNWLNSVIWLVKLVGSIWILKIVMYKYGQANKNESTFAYGMMVCLCSSVICAMWSFILYAYLFPSKIKEAFDQVYSAFAEQAASMPDGFEDALLKVEDNFAQLSCIGTLIWCILLGLIICSILKGRTSAGKNIFDQETNSTEE